MGASEVLKLTLKRRYSIICRNKQAVVFLRYFISIIAFFLLPVAGLNCSGGDNSKESLTIEDALLAVRDSTGQYAVTNNNDFRRGDEINMVLYRVGKFEKGPDGKHLFDMDIEVTGPDGRMLFTKKELFGENGHVLLPDDMADMPCGTYQTSPEFQPGTYRMKLTIYDKISGKSASRTRLFVLH
jgi:hypothetical protein